jgi:hypothetical protein
MANGKRHVTLSFLQARKQHQIFQRVSASPVHNLS